MEDDLNLAAGDGHAFEPTEDELLLHFLRPQLRGFLPRVAGAVAEVDLRDAAPWELVARHGRAGHGYFFVARDRRSPLVRRSVRGGGGCWMPSSNKTGRSITELGVVVPWRKLKFCFYTRDEEGERRSTGWVMAEYMITDPRCYRRADEGKEGEYWVLCHITKSKRASPPSRATMRHGIAI